MLQFVANYAGEIIAFTLSALLATAAEIWSPIPSPQRHFWSIIFFVLSFVLGLSVNGSFTMNKRINEVDRRFERLVELEQADVEAHLVTKDYDQIIEKASKTLRSWGEDSVTALDNDLKQGYIPISVERAAITIGTAYSDATKSIIASNVGSIDFYFNVRSYVAQNVEAQERHIPIVRFFIYSREPKRDIKLTNTCVDRNLKADSVEDFSKCVVALNRELGSLCSIVVDFDKQFERLGVAKDLMLMDNSFIAETDLNSENWSQKRAKATEASVSAQAALEVRTYFHTLWAISGDTCTAAMDDADIRKRFQQFKDVQPRAHERLADAVFRRVMEDATGPP